MSAHNWWEFGKTGAKWGAVGGALLSAPAVVLAAATMNPVAIAGALLFAAVKTAGGAVLGGLGGSAVGAFTKDKGKGETIPVQTPNGRTFEVSVEDLERAPESTRFQDMVNGSRPMGARTH